VKNKLLRKLNYHIITKLTVLITAGIILLFGGCPSLKGEGFAIYLTEEDIPPARMPALSHIDIAEQPIVATRDIIKYSTNTHEITLTENAFNRISNLEVPVRGKSFVVCVDRKTIYWGAFWTPISSISFDGVTIWKPLYSKGSKVLKLDLDYPSSEFYGSEDPRNNIEIIESLEQAGKLVTGPSNTTVDELQYSVKGYELYSWLENSQWHFTLITGTNRDKALEEILSPVNIISEDRWVQTHVVDTDAIRIVLSKLPKNEEVIWRTILQSEQTQDNGVNITLPCDRLSILLRNTLYIMI